MSTRPPFRPALESLEGREMLDATPLASVGLLQQTVSAHLRETTDERFAIAPRIADVLDVQNGRLGAGEWTANDDQLGQIRFVNGNPTSWIEADNGRLQVNGGRGPLSAVFPEPRFVRSVTVDYIDGAEEGRLSFDLADGTTRTVALGRGGTFDVDAEVKAIRLETMRESANRYALRSIEFGFDLDVAPHTMDALAASNAAFQAERTAEAGMIDTPEEADAFLLDGAARLETARTDAAALRTQLDTLHDAFALSNARLQALRAQVPGATGRKAELLAQAIAAIEGASAGSTVIEWTETPSVATVSGNSGQNVIQFKWNTLPAGMSVAIRDGSQLLSRTSLGASGSVSLAVPNDRGRRTIELVLLNGSGQVVKSVASWTAYKTVLESTVTGDRALPEFTRFDERTVARGKSLPQLRAEIGAVTDAVIDAEALEAALSSTQAWLREWMHALQAAAAQPEPEPATAEEAAPPAPEDVEYRTITPAFRVSTQGKTLTLHYADMPSGMRWQYRTHRTGGSGEVAIPEGSGSVTLQLGTLDVYDARLRILDGGNREYGPPIDFVYDGGSYYRPPTAETVFLTDLQRQEAVERGDIGELREMVSEKITPSLRVAGIEGLRITFVVATPDDDARIRMLLPEQQSRFGTLEAYYLSTFGSGAQTSLFAGSVGTLGGSRGAPLSTLFDQRLPTGSYTYVIESGALRDTVTLSWHQPTRTLALADPSDQWSAAPAERSSAAAQAVEEEYMGLLQADVEGSMALQGALLASGVSIDSPALRTLQGAQMLEKLSALPGRGLLPAEDFYVLFFRAYPHLTDSAVLRRAAEAYAADPRNPQGWYERMERDNAREILHIAEGHRDTYWQLLTQVTDLAVTQALRLWQGADPTAVMQEVQGILNQWARQKDVAIGAMRAIGYPAWPDAVTVLGIGQRLLERESTLLLSNQNVASAQRAEDDAMRARNLRLNAAGEWVAIKTDIPVLAEAPRPSRTDRLVQEIIRNSNDARIVAWREATTQETQRQIAGVARTTASETIERTIEANGDIRTVMTAESLGRIRDLAAKALESAKERWATEEIAHFTKLLEAAEGLLRLIPPGSNKPDLRLDPRGREWAEYIERTTTDPAPKVIVWGDAKEYSDSNILLSWGLITEGKSPTHFRVYVVNGKPGSQNGDPADLELSGDLRQSYLKISTADIAAALGKIGQTFRQDVQLMVVAWFTDGTWTKEPGVLTVKVGHTANREAAVRSALNGLSRPVSEGTSYVLLGQSTGPGSTVPNTQQPPRWIAVPETNHIESFIAYIKDSAEQIALGNFTDKVTVGGTTGQIALGFAGLDVAGDMRDLSADLANWEWSWAHGAQTTLDLIGFLPVIGSIKYGDEVALLVKRYAKQGNEIVEAGVEVVRGVNRRIDGMFNLLLKEFPNGHAVFKHVGQSDAQLKAMLATDSAASAFTDILSAQHSIDATLARYSKEISDWVSDSTQIQRKVLEMDMGNFIGRRVTDASPDTIRDVTKVRVVLTKNEQGGWNLLTAYPIE